MKRTIRLFLNDSFIITLIIFNALVMFIQEFESRANKLDYIEILFTILFIIELIVKIKTYGFAKYIGSGWNRIDFILIVASIPSLAIFFYQDNTFQLNIFLTLRAFRVFKFFRLIRFFPNVNGLIDSLKRAIKASYIVIFGFFILVFIVSLVTCALFKKVAPEYFSNPLTSFYSIFRLFSIEGWYEIPNLIGSRSTPIIETISKLYFVILLLFGGIIGLSLVNSIFVDAMVSDNNDELKNEVSNLSAKIDELTGKIEKLTNQNSSSP